MNKQEADRIFQENWKSMESWIDGSMQSLTHRLKHHPHTDGGWIENYVNDALRQAMTAGRGPWTDEADFEHEVFETHDEVVVKFRLPDGVSPEGIRASAARQQIRFDGFADGHPRTIDLPRPVVPAACRAVCSKGVLQVRLPRAEKREDFHEIHIRRQDD